VSVVTSPERSSQPTTFNDEERYKRLFRALVAVGASREGAGDALQDAYEKALRRAEVPERLEGWLFVVAQRQWRRQHLRQRLFRPLSAARGQASRPSESGVVLAEVRKLPIRQRQVFIARHVLGLSNEETARALGIADGTVSATNHHALRTLRTRLGEEQ